MIPTNNCNYNIRQAQVFVTIIIFLSWGPVVRKKSNAKSVQMGYIYERLQTTLSKINNKIAKQNNL